MKLPRAKKADRNVKRTEAREIKTDCILCDLTVKWRIHQQKVLQRLPLSSSSGLTTIRGGDTSATSSKLNYLELNL